MFSIRSRLGEGICFIIKSVPSYGLWPVFIAEVTFSSLKQQGGCFTNPISFFP